MTLAEQLRKAIDWSGLTLTEIAEGTGIDYGSLYRFYYGQRSFRLETADKLAKLFGMRLTRPRKPKEGGA